MWILLSPHTTRVGVATVSRSPDAVNAKAGKLTRRTTLEAKVLDLNSSQFDWDGLLWADL